MSTPLPMMHDCCGWQRLAQSCDCPISVSLAAVSRAAGNLWHTFARRQARKLERRLAAVEPKRRWLHTI